MRTKPAWGRRRRQGGASASALRNDRSRSEDSPPDREEETLAITSLCSFSCSSITEALSCGCTFKKKVSMKVSFAALAVFGTYLARLGQSAGVYGSQKSCSVPRVDSGGQGLSCPDAPPSTLDEAIANGWRFAPIVKFHPLETYFMASPDDWFATSSLYPAPGDGLTKAFRSQHGPDVSILDASELAVNNVTAFDSEGRSTAKVYFTVQEYAVCIDVDYESLCRIGSLFAHLTSPPNNI